MYSAHEAQGQGRARRISFMTLKGRPCRAPSLYITGCLLEQSTVEGRAKLVTPLRLPAQSRRDCALGIMAHNRPPCLGIRAMRLICKGVDKGREQGIVALP